jgi:hypothetical protein
MEVAMLKIAHVSALILGLALAGRTVAQDLQPTSIHPAVLTQISALTAEADFTVFMHEDVPEELRRAALRRLWTLMELHVSCMDLCHDAEPVPQAALLLASEQRSVPVQ